MLLHTIYLYGYIWWIVAIRVHVLAKNTLIENEMGETLSVV